MKLSSQQKNNKLKNRRWSILSLVLIILVALGYLAYAYHSRSSWPFQTKQNNAPAESRDVNQVDYGPPSQDDVNQSQTGKQNSTNQDSSSVDNTTQQNTTAKKSVAVGVSFADVVDHNVEIRAFTPSIIEGGGKCTAQLKKGALVVSATSEAFVDSSSSQCHPIYIDLSNFPEKGEWSLIVTYSSNNAEGSSEKIGVTL